MPNNTDREDAMRQEFEAHCADVGIPISRGDDGGYEYADFRTNAAWDAWQAARAEANHAKSVYDKLHAGKLGMHWAWQMLEQLAADVPEDEVLREVAMRVDRWLPIESAPKDGTVILLLHGSLVAAGWHRNHPHYEWCFVDGVEMDENNLIEPNAWLKKYPPTHWRPLPPPPKASETKEGEG